MCARCASAQASSSCCAAAATPARYSTKGSCYRAPRLVRTDSRGRRALAKPLQTSGFTWLRTEGRPESSAPGFARPTSPRTTCDAIPNGRRELACASLSLRFLQEAQHIERAKDGEKMHRLFGGYRKPSPAQVSTVEWTSRRRGRTLLTSRRELTGV